MLVTVALEDRISALTTKDPAKLAVYLGAHQYIVTINGVDHQITEHTVVDFDGRRMTGKELYEIYSNSQS